jgi:hypothetical protein
MKSKYKEILIPVIFVIACFITAAIILSFEISTLKKQNKFLTEQIDISEKNNDKDCKCGEYWWDRSYFYENSFRECVYNYEQSVRYLEDCINNQK